MRESVIITGMGVVSAIGIGKDNFFRALREGRSGIKEITGFKTEINRKMYGGEISDFDAPTYLGKKGLRHITGGTKMLLAAGRMALLDNSARLSSVSPDQRKGVILGSTLGVFDAISEFDKEALRSGWRGVNPMEFPNCVINAPAGQLAIKEKAEGLNLTVSSGQVSSLDALGMALHYLAAEQEGMILAGGIAELGPCIYLMFTKAGLLCNFREDFNPLGEKRTGTLLGEGSVVFVMEKEERREKTKAAVFARVEGYETVFDAKSAQLEYDPEAKAAIQAVKLALADAQAQPQDIDFVSSGLSGIRDADEMELRAIRAVFGADFPIIAIKQLIGETFDAAGAFQAAAAIYVFENSCYPKQCTLNIPSAGAYRRPRRALITSFGFNGHNSALVIAK